MMKLFFAVAGVLALEALGQDSTSLEAVETIAAAVRSTESPNIPTTTVAPIEYGIINIDDSDSTSVAETSTSQIPESPPTTQSAESAAMTTMLTQTTVATAPLPTSAPAVAVTQTPGMRPAVTTTPGGAAIEAQPPAGEPSPTGAPAVTQAPAEAPLPTSNPWWMPTSEPVAAAEVLTETAVPTSEPVVATEVLTETPVPTSAPAEVVQTLVDQPDEPAVAATTTPSIAVTQTPDLRPVATSAPVFETPAPAEKIVATTTPIARPVATTTPMMVTTTPVAPDIQVLATEAPVVRPAITRAPVIATVTPVVTTTPAIGVEVARTTTPLPLVDASAATTPAYYRTTVMPKMTTLPASLASSTPRVPGTSATLPRDDVPMCTASVRECADGSFVSRDPQLDCEFRPCPQVSTTEIVATTGPAVALPIMTRFFSTSRPVITPVEDVATTVRPQQGGFLQSTTAVVVNRVEVLPVVSRAPTKAPVAKSPGAQSYDGQQVDVDETDGWSLLQLIILLFMAMGIARFCYKKFGTSPQRGGKSKSHGIQMGASTLGRSYQPPSYMPVSLG